MKGLSKNPDLKPFWSGLETLEKHFADLPIYTPVCSVIVEIFEKIIQDIKKGRSLQESISRAQNGEYFGPESEQRNIFKDNQEFILEFIGKTIQFVTVIMNKDEALELAKENIDNCLLEDLVKIKINLIDNWIEKYKKNTTEWLPFDNDTDSLFEIVSQIQSRSTPFIPIFTDIAKINHPDNRELLKQLRQDGCILIIDCLSLQHPKLLKCFYQSGLDMSPKTSVIVLSSNKNIENQIQDVISTVKIPFLEMEFNKRIGESSQCRWAFQKVSLQGWLNEHVQNQRQAHSETIKKQKPVMPKLFFQTP